MIDRDATMPVIMEESQTDMDTTLDKDETMIKKDVSA